MNSRNLRLKHGVHKTVTRKHRLALELGRNDHSLECLTTTAYRYPLVLSRIKFSRSHTILRTRQILDIHVLSLQLLHKLVLQRVRCDARGIGHCGVDGSEGARGEREEGAGGVRAEEIAAASAQDSEGGRAGKHQEKVMRLLELKIPRVDRD